MKPALQVALVLLAFSGCALVAQRDFLAEEYRTEDVKLPYSLGKLKIVDKRTPSAKEETVQPGLTDQDSGLIKSELAQYFQDGQPRVNADVEVLEAKEEFKGIFNGRRETATTRIKVQLIDAASKEPLFYALGESTLFFQSNMLSDEFARKLYDKGFKVAIFQAAKSLKIGAQQ